MSDLDYERARLSLMKAIARLQVSARLPAGVTKRVHGAGRG
jgi:hypothetical protein